MLNYFCINKSGKSVPVYNGTNGATQIGSIYNREAFGYDRKQGGDDYFCHIIFRNSSGSLTYGYIIDPPEKFLTYCTSYPYGSVTINGTKYKTFLMRKSRTVYTSSANKWGTVAANCRVACTSAESGSSHPDWKAINYVENSSGNWVQVTGNGSNYGFVDTGLSVGSSYTSIPMYGKW